ncbi:cobalamin biosynthesis protein CobW [Haloprofundus marisrubri]|uniref:Cobalamin biosynthesis protein CobW n=1 Tax=Haloprofundus marisrubri TaxID=1514971 RepID=A0A0W1RET6_9EURY|nr:GTP-binding protein [Haloprofundus marisrubri]KTG11670.1 cobalamin biosynthesis protein CobW [Haloprofundus marisrubri]
MTQTIPVTILSGSLGAGKTTLLNHLLRNAGDRNIAVLVNDMGDLNVDAELVSANSDLSVGDGVAELSNGCICCELQDDLETAVTRLARNRDFDVLVVESSGISEPEPVARLFTTGSRAAALYEVDSLVTVLDSRLFYDTFGGTGVAERRGTDGDDSRPLSDLLVEQVEFANVVLLNKADLVSETEMGTVEEMVRALAPDAEILRTTESAVDANDLFSRELYDPATAAEMAGWQQALDADDHDDGSDSHVHGDDHAHDHRHPDEVYGVSSFTYRRRRPFHPERFAAFLSDLPSNVVRSKGTCWVAGRESPIVVGQAGSSVRAEAAGQWIATLSELDQELYRSNHSDMEWHDEWGDRRTAFVVIGTDLDEEATTVTLDDCLLTDEEMESDWEAFANPFPRQGEELVVTEP